MAFPVIRMTGARTVTYLQRPQDFEAIHSRHPVVDNQAGRARQLRVVEQVVAASAGVNLQPLQLERELRDSRTARSSSTTRTTCDLALMDFRAPPARPSRLWICVNDHPGGGRAPSP